MEINQIPALKAFYDNEIQREAVKDFIVKQLHVMAVQKVMKREDTSGLADAKDVVEQTFIRLDEIYGNKPKPSVSNSR